MIDLCFFYIGLHSFPKAIYQKVRAYLKLDQIDDDIHQSDAYLNKPQIDIPNGEVLEKLSDKISMHEYDESRDLEDREVIPIPVLDFAGQIVYHATHQTFITSHGIYLLTFDGSKSLDDPLSTTGDCRMTTILGRSSKEKSV